MKPSNLFQQLDVLHLRLSYLAGNDFYVKSIGTTLQNELPSDRSNLNVYYSAMIEWKDKATENHYIAMIGDTPEELQEKCRKFFILHRNEHINVDKLDKQYPVNHEL